MESTFWEIKVLYNYFEGLYYILNEGNGLLDYDIKFSFVEHFVGGGAILCLLYTFYSYLDIL